MSGTRFRFLSVELTSDGKATGFCVGCGCRCKVGNLERGAPHQVHSCCLIGAFRPSLADIAVCDCNTSPHRRSCASQR